MYKNQYFQKIIDVKKYTNIKRTSKYGSFGHIFEVTDTETGKIFVAKIIDCEGNEEVCKVVDHEVFIMMCCDHPTINKVIGFSLKDFWDGDNVTIIMEYMKNGSLGDLLKRIQNKQIPENYTNTNRQIILIGVAKGMKYLHDRNIINRDLKPANVLLDDNYHPIITDFGESKFFEQGHSKSHSRSCIGTAQYMSPEIIEGEKYNGKTDVYSYGILMYEVVTELDSYPEIKKDFREYAFFTNVSKYNHRPTFPPNIN